MFLKKTILSILFIFLISFNTIANTGFKEFSDKPNIKINIKPKTVVYEGDIIDCVIENDVSKKYWTIDNKSKHYSFLNDDPVIFDPEPTPLKNKYVNFTVYAENKNGVSSKTVQIILKKIFFGDIHWHTTLCDGYYSIDEMYQNAINDNYLDFVCYTGHSEWIDGYRSEFRNNGFFNKYTYIKNWIHYKSSGFNDWILIKDKAKKYYNPGNFTTFLGFEWTSGKKSNASNINFYYKEVYEDALHYSSIDYPTFEDIFKEMCKENARGNYNIGFPHQPQCKSTPVNWTYLYNNVNDSIRNNILRGVETYSTWGSAIGGKYTPEIPYNWPYYDKYFADKKSSWSENAMWEHSFKTTKNNVFSLMASSDIHRQNRPGSAKSEGFDFRHPYNPSGLIAAYSVHNTRNEIWDAMDNGDIYALQQLKIRANVRFDNKIKYGRWINCTTPLEINITACSTFPILDNNKKSMCPHGYSSSELNHYIKDIWIIKNDQKRGQPWCKIINHSSLNKKIVNVIFKDHNVEPNDFYWIAILQKGDLLIPKSVLYLSKLFPDMFNSWFKEKYHRDEYMAFIGPIFIKNVK